MKKLLTLEEVADYLRVTKKTVYRLLEKRAIPAIKVGHQWRFDTESIDSWLSSNTIEAVASILVIDDDDTICTLFEDTLEDLGHTVTIVNIASKGLDLVKEQDFDMVFLDLKMPELDGAELYGQIKAFKPNLPVTIITGYPDSDLMIKALAYGPLGFIKKPFTSSDIINAVSNYLYFNTMGNRSKL